MVAVLACSQTLGGRFARAIASPTIRVDVHPRFQDCFSIGGVVPAIDIAPGEIDDDIGPIDFRGPSAERYRVPGNSAPRYARGLAAKHDDIRARRPQMPEPELFRLVHCRLE